MKFTEFKGNERVVDYFRKAIQGRHLGHAFLFSGPEGVGKSTVARIISKTLLCRNPQPDGPCGACPACHKFDSGNHADFHEYSPDGLYFKIDQVRDIIHQSSLKPVEAPWKVFLLEDVEYMRDEASNALLKSLEEPPGQTIFFLVSENADILLPTIRSRCQNFPFQPLSLQEVEDWLVQNREFSKDDAAAQARYSHGSIGRALSVNVEKYREIRDRILVVFEAAILPKTYFVLLDAIKAITVERAEMPDRFLIMEELTRDLIVLSGGAGTLVHEDVTERLTAMASKTPLHVLQTFYDELLETRETVLRVNANTGLSLQALFLPLRAA